MKVNEFLNLLQQTSENLKEIKKEAREYLTPNTEPTFWSACTKAQVNIDKVARLLRKERKT